MLQDMSADMGISCTESVASYLGEGSEADAGSDTDDEIHPVDHDPSKIRAGRCQGTVKCVACTRWTMKGAGHADADARVLG